MTYCELGAWRCTAEVRQIPSQVYHTNAEPGSCLRTWSHKVVSIPPEKDQSLDPEQNHRRPRLCRPTGVLHHEHVSLPFQYGHNGGKQSKGQVGEELYLGAESKLHGVAFGTSHQLQIRAIGSESVGCQCCQSGMELLPCCPQPGLALFFPSSRIPHLVALKELTTSSFCAIFGRGRAPQCFL